MEKRAGDCVYVCVILFLVSSFVRCVLCVLTFARFAPNLLLVAGSEIRAMHFAFSSCKHQTEVCYNFTQFEFMFFNALLDERCYIM